jgi:hypothetical protein
MIGISPLKRVDSRFLLDPFEPRLVVSDVSLPHVSAGSAPTLNVSRPAQRSLALRPT